VSTLSTQKRDLKSFFQTETKRWKNIVFLEISGSIKIYINIIVLSGKNCCFSRYFRIYQILILILFLYLYILILYEVGVKHQPINLLILYLINQSRYCINKLYFH
jgi:hypothetical protein